MSVILSLLERASIAVVVVVVGAGEGRSLASLGRPRTILRCNVMLLVMGLSPGPQSHAVGTDQCAIFRIVAISTIFSTCHCLSSIITAWHLSSLKRTSIVSYCSLERASIISISSTRVSPRRILTFTGHRSKYIRERAHAASVSVTNVRTYAHTHTDTTNCKYR